MKPEALQEKLNELNVLQQRLSIFTQQRQQLELSNAEITTSAEEVSKAKGKVYSLTGNVILEKDAKTLKTELETQKKEQGRRMDEQFLAVRFRGQVGSHGCFLRHLDGIETAGVHVNPPRSQAVTSNHHHNQELPPGECSRRS